MYCLQQLGEISQAKVQTLNFVDEIEVHLDSRSMARSTVAVWVTWAASSS